MIRDVEVLEIRDKYEKGMTVVDLALDTDIVIKPYGNGLNEKICHVTKSDQSGLASWILTKSIS